LLGARGDLHYPPRMIYRFGAFELDLATRELRAEGKPRSVEPQVFDLLVLLVGNRERLVTREELIEKVWDGRVVSEAALSSRVKSARQAIGDDGAAQRLIRTVHGRGFRFVGEVAQVAAAGVATTPGAAAPGVSASAVVPQPASPEPPGADASRPSIAVLPFRLVGAEGPCAGLALALPHELIIEMSRLRWLLVIARGSSFRLDAATTGHAEIGRLLGVRYCLSGTVMFDGRALVVTVELVDTRDASLVWADRCSGPVDDVHRMREAILQQTLAALEIRVPLHEAGHARLLVAENLDAWSAYHLGLQHMYRFNRVDNAAAAALFGRAVALDPGFARAHAGLSFVHFQTAFLRHTDDVAGEIDQARRHAERGLELDPVDPFVNFTMGRTFWLRGELESSLGWLERSTTLSPNYAQGIYARAWTEALAGRPLEGREHVDHAMRLSPLDPMYYAMLGTRAFTHLALGEEQEAALWAERAARAPGAHVLIAMIAAALQALAGDGDRAAAWAANVRERNGALRRDDFFRSFPMKSAGMRARVSQALERLGF
jgi:DNA-binding winged helix-turn-helix (wHTH) protein/TolB-like protein